MRALSWQRQTGRPRLDLTHGPLPTSTPPPILVPTQLVRESLPGYLDSTGQGLVRDALRTTGTALTLTVRRRMESFLGQDLSGVRVHTGQAARESAARLDAKAFTSGEHIVLGDFGTDQRTLAHELVHVVQQRQGPVDGVDLGDGMRLSDPGDRFEREAEQAADDFLAGKEHILVSAGPAPATRTGSVLHPQTVQRRVGFEFEAQWNVRRQPQDDAARTASLKEHHDDVQAYDEQYGQAILEGVILRNKNRLPEWFPEHYAQLTTMEPYASQAGDRAAGPSTAAEGPHTRLRITASVEDCCAWLAKAREFNRRGYGQMINGVLNSNFIDGTTPKPPLPGVSLKKKDVIIRRPGFRLEADTTPSGGSQLEFVTDPMKTRNQVENTLAAVTEMAHGAESYRHLSEIPATMIHRAAERDLFIYPDGMPLSISPQATAGLKLAQVATMVRYLQTAEGRADHGMLMKEPDRFASCVALATARVRAAHPDQADVDELISLVAWLMNYLEEAENLQSEGNSKGIAGGFMSRTEFSHNFGRLPWSLRRYYRKNAHEFVELVAGTHAEEPIFPRRIARGEAEYRESLDIHLTKAQWLEGITQGFDYLTAALTDGLHDSLGALGTTTDRVGPGVGVLAVIAEFRRMPDNVSINELTPLALRTFDFIEMINANAFPVPGQPAGAIPEAPELPVTPGVLDNLKGLFTSCFKERRI